MTLTDYVRLIEVRWLSKYRLHSTSNIGFDGMQMVSATGGIKNAVILPVNLEVRGLSKDVYDFVEFINTAGTLPDITSSTGSLALDAKTLLSNPLVRITGFVPSEIPRAGFLPPRSSTARRRGRSRRPGRWSRDARPRRRRRWSRSRSRGAGGTENPAPSARGTCAIRPCRRNPGPCRARPAKRQAPGPCCQTNTSRRNYYPSGHRYAFF